MMKLLKWYSHFVGRAKWLRQVKAGLSTFNLPSPASSPALPQARQVPSYLANAQLARQATCLAWGSNLADARSDRNPGERQERATFNPIRFLALCLMMTVLTACQFRPLNPASTSTPSPSSTPTPEPSATATLSPTQTLAPSPTPPASAATATQLSGPLPLCQTDATPAANGWAICHSLRYGFELSYPADSSLGEMREEYARIDLPFTPGTNLVEKYLEITASPGVKTCTSPLAQGFEPAAVPTQPVSLQSLGFIRQEGREGAAGNHYQWVAYSITKGDVCLSLSFVLHSTNPENFATPPVEFNPQQESAIFDQIMATFRWVE